MINLNELLSQPSDSRVLLWTETEQEAGIGRIFQGGKTSAKVTMDLLTEVTITDYLVEADVATPEGSERMQLTITPKAEKEDVAKAIWNALGGEKHQNWEGLLFSLKTGSRTVRITPMWAVGRRGGVQAQRTFWSLAKYHSKRIGALKDAKNTNAFDRKRFFEVK